MDQRIEFYVEQFGDGWRATLSDNYVTWGYGEDPYDAIGNLCVELSYDAQQENEASE